MSAWRPSKRLHRLFPRIKSLRSTFVYSVLQMSIPGKYLQATCFDLRKHPNLIHMKSFRASGNSLQTGTIHHLMMPAMVKIFNDLVPVNTMADYTSGATRLFYYSSTLYVNEAVDAISGGTDCISAVDQDCKLPGRPFTPSSSCVEAAHSIISVFTSLDLVNIRGMPTIFLVRVIHATMFLVKFSSEISSYQSNRSNSPRRDDSKVEQQLDDLIEIMASWGLDWPACRLIQILIRLRKQLRENKTKLPSSPRGSSSPNSTTSQADQDTTQSSTPSFPELPTPSLYQDFPQQPLNLPLADFSIPNDTLYGDPVFWDAICLDQTPQSKQPILPAPSHIPLWQMLESQPQQQAFSPDGSLPSGYPQSTEFFSSEQSESYPLTYIFKCSTKQSK